MVVTGLPPLLRSADVFLRPRPLDIRATIAKIGAAVADEEHIRRLQQGAEAWNTWRRDILRRGDLSHADLRGANLNEADLHEAYLRGAGAPKPLRNRLPVTCCPARRRPTMSTDIMCRATLTRARILQRE